MSHDAHHQHHPEKVAAAPVTEATPRHPWLVLVLLCLAQFMLILDITVVNVALPSIGDDLGLGREALTWVVTSYALVFGGLMLLGGRLADVLGRRTTFLAGLVVFTAASLVSGLADSGALLIAGRMTQGVGAALLSPAALALVTTTFRGAERNKALGVWAGVGATGSAAGVLVGGLLTSGPGWEWIFFVNVPVGTAVFVAVLALVPEARRSERSGRLDIPGAILVTAATALLILGVTRYGDNSWTDMTVWLPILGAAVLYPVFLAVESATQEPLLKPALLTRRAVVTGAFTMLVATGLLISSFFLGSLYLQQVVGLSALRTGLAFLPVAIAVGLGAHLAANLLTRFGPGPIAATGLAITAVGAAWLTQLPADGGLADILPGLILAGVGVGPAFVAATTTAMAHVDHREAGLVSGLVNTFHELGGALGVALVSAAAAASLTPASATVEGYTDAFLGCAAAAALAALVMLALAPRAPLPVRDGPRHVH
ncbi:MFS transporter [Yinghuangia soli]|uniref:DHA2 family efflux MFS transporter permease subunit n=1 Tax=Yinghuangia soli TaxID=2908204 RepID=A0AA41Q9C1_9ACTN|nr:MFS transporter [Yinghuangia soli]MCF2533151.1 DHA2 family efflux MFS transporter permease subunit [Yinghuangia soli]